MSKLTSYRGLNAVITGASSGIGKLLALRLAREGAPGALVPARAGELEAGEGALLSEGGEAAVLPCDVAERAQVFATAATALERLGSVELLVNNAGYGHHRPFLEWD